MKRTLQTLFLATLLITGLIGAELFVPKVVDATTITPIAGKNYTLYAGGLSSSATSITLTSFTYPATSTPIVTADLGTTAYATLEPGNTSRQEIVSFTGVTQNSDGTATLTGVTRGLKPFYPYTTDSTLKKQHPGGTTVVLSNPPQLYNDIIAYVNAAIFAGAADASTIVKGIVELATQAETAASTQTGGSGPLVIQNQYATSTYNTNTAANRVVVTKTNGHIDFGFIATNTPSSATASSTLITDGSGTLYWNPVTRLFLPNTTTVATTITTSSTTVLQATIPANALGKDGVIHIKAYGSYTSPNAAGAQTYIDIGFGSGTTTTSIDCSTCSPTFGVTTQFFLDYYVKGNSATNSQRAAAFISLSTTSPAILINKGGSGTSSPAVDTTIAQPFYVIARSLNTNSISFDSIWMEIIR